ncbi:MAG: ATP-dependent DNA helicase RecG [Bacteroidetes bacterium]|nr:ATP-dependent DNA helicase RecG [Bacteroidota bacterium]
MSYNFAETPIEFLKGVGPKRAELLSKELNIRCFGDLLQYYPFRYIDRSKFHKANEITSDLVYVQMKGKIVATETIGKMRASRFVATFKDETGSIELVWFQGIKWIKEKLKLGEEYVVFGKPSIFNKTYNILHPDIELLSENQSEISEGLYPYYSSSEKLKAMGFTSRGISKITKTLVIMAKNSIPETLTPEIISKYKFISREEALINIHFPANAEILQKAQIRIKFEELFYLQLSLLMMRQIRLVKTEGHRFTSVGEHFNAFYNTKLPFELTNAQKRVIKEIRTDLGSGKQMNRLLQGDVGSGKTLVALMCMLIALDNNYQSCLMVPTEILANQHFETISRMLDGLNVNVELLTGSTKAAKRKKIDEGLQSAQIHILIGTHALIEDTVQFANLGLVIIDEQHRFGVEQRAKLWNKNEKQPHILVMTATPIPRTLAMTLYGDLDYSAIDEMPPGRKSIKTYHYFDSGRLKVFAFLKQQVNAGRQVYVVYPLINESVTLDLKDLMDGYNSITREFPLPEYAVSIVHGQMKSADKDYEMQRFVKGETQLMVSTTVIEVGVDVPNASVMLIENAERFGLSQLHQLRGRVGRGAEQSYCILMTGNKLTSDGRKRIETMVRTTDGFEIAEADLKLRGPGDMQGTQQSGMLDLHLADIVKDEKLIKHARDLAIDILKHDAMLESQKNQKLREQLQRMKKVRGNWEKIS